MRKELLMFVGTAILGVSLLVVICYFAAKGVDHDIQAAQRRAWSVTDVAKSWVRTNELEVNVNSTFCDWGYTNLLRCSSMNRFGQTVQFRCNDTTCVAGW